MADQQFLSESVPFDQTSLRGLGAYDKAYLRLTSSWYASPFIYTGKPMVGFGMVYSRNLPFYAYNPSFAAALNSTANSCAAANSDPHRITASLYRAPRFYNGGLPSSGCQAC